MPYYLVADSIYTKKLYSRFSSSEVQFYTKTAVLRFEPPLGA